MHHRHSQPLFPDANDNVLKEVEHSADFLRHTILPPETTTLTTPSRAQPVNHVSYRLNQRFRLNRGYRCEMNRITFDHFKQCAIFLAATWSFVNIGTSLESNDHATNKDTILVLKYS